MPQWYRTPPVARSRSARRSPSASRASHPRKLRSPSKKLPRSPSSGPPSSPQPSRCRALPPKKPSPTSSRCALSRRSEQPSRPPSWGGGNSSFRSLGSDEALLREAYDEIAAGRPTVVHVAGPYGEHWICLMGYQGVEDPDALSLDNFIALDPANGLEVTASYRYAPYGDACEHVSDLR